MKRIVLLHFFLLLELLQVCAQPAEQLIKVIVAPDHANWEYKQGEPVKFTITVLQNGNPLKNIPLRYELGPEKSPR